MSSADFKYRSPGCPRKTETTEYNTCGWELSAKLRLLLRSWTCFGATGVNIIWQARSGSDLYSTPKTASMRTRPERSLMMNCTNRSWTTQISSFFLIAALGPIGTCSCSSFWYGLHLGCPTRFAFSKLKDHHLGLLQKYSWTLAGSLISFSPSSQRSKTLIPTDLNFVRVCWHRSIWSHGSLSTSSPHFLGHSQKQLELVRQAPLPMAWRPNCFECWNSTGCTDFWGYSNWCGYSGFSSIWLKATPGIVVWVSFTHCPQQ